MTDGELIQFTIYRHPRDYPQGYVVREWRVGPGTVAPASRMKCTSLEEARAYVQSVTPGMVMLTRAPGDDPSIVETWV